jgi:hypothetical protein
LFIFWFNYKIYESDKCIEKSPEKSKGDSQFAMRTDGVIYPDQFSEEEDNA